MTWWLSIHFGQMVLGRQKWFQFLKVDVYMLVRKLVEAVLTMTMKIKVVSPDE